MTQYYREHSKVWVSVDCIVFGFENNQLKLLIGRRQMDPGRGEWSLYGGFVRDDEGLDEAANRVLYSLTGLKEIYMKQVGARQQYELEWADLGQLPKLYSDHNQMVSKAISLLRRRIKTEPLSFNLLPDLFTLTQLQHVYEAILGCAIDKRNFRKRIKQIDFIEKTELIDKKTSKRGAALYRFNKKMYADDPTFKL